MLTCEIKGRSIPVEMWAGQVLGSFFALDTETELIVEGTTPDLILGSAYDGETAYIITLKDMPAFLAVNMTPIHRIVMHTAKFDVNVLDKACGVNFRNEMDNGRLLDIAILYRLVKIAQTGQAPHRYSLDRITKELCHFVLDKNEMIRMTFGDGHLTDDHLIYAAKDAVATFMVAKVLLEQTRMIEDGCERKMLGHRLQLQASMALYDMHNRPVHVDMPRVCKLKKDIERGMLQTSAKLVGCGYNPNRTGTTARYNGIIRPILEDAGIDIILTGKEDKQGRKHNISQKREYLMPVYDNPFVKYYLEYGSDKKLLSTFIKPLKESGGIIYPGYELLMATGRTSCRKPNIQQQPRRGGVRECIIPPEGHVFLAADYSWIELCTLSQYLIEMFGTSTMADMLNSGIDPHIGTASRLLNKSARNVTKNERQQAKVVNFGLPGGLSAAALRGFARLQYGVEWSPTESVEIREKWLKVFPDVEDYLSLGWNEVVFNCGRRRGNCTFTVAHNTPFQGIAADGIKRAMYTAYRSGMASSIMVHDELILTTPIAPDYTEQGQQLVDTMLAGMQVECPDVLIGAKVHAMPRWYKEAKPVLDNGKLLCYTEENEEQI